MHTLFRDIGMHASLGRAIEQIGGNRFWKQLILLLRQHLPFDNALAIFYPCLLYTSPSPRDVEESRMPSSA